MKKKNALLCCALVTMSLSLSACNFLPENFMQNFGGNSKQNNDESSELPHLHTFDLKRWESDDTYHWHPCTCGHDLQGEKRAHTFGKPVVISEATCETSGEKIETCTVCGYEKHTYTEKRNHNWQVYYTKDATCIEQGEIRSHCTYCNETRVTYTDCVGHSYHVLNEIPGTCQTPGKRIEECSVCGDYRETILPSHHVWVDEEYIDYLDNGSDSNVPFYKSHCAYDDNIRISINAKDGLLNGKMKESPIDGFIKLASNGSSLTYTFYSESESYGILYQRGYMDSWSNSSYRLATYRNDSIGAGYNFSVTVNGEAIDLSPYADTTYEDMLKDGEDSGNSNYSPIADCPIGRIHLLSGFNTIRFTRNSVYNLYIQSFNMIVERVASHEHQFASSWSYDNQCHWFECLDPNCPDVGARFGLETHTFQETVLSEPTCSSEGIIRKTCLICGFSTEITTPAYDHNLIYIGTIGYDGCTSADEYQCSYCGEVVLRWNAKSFDNELSNDVEMTTNDYIRVKYSQFEKGDTSVNGTHIVYKIYSPTNVYNASLAFKAYINLNSISVFEAMESDTKRGYEYNNQGELEAASHRYGLNVNGVRVPLGEDPYRDTRFNGSIEWYNWPVTFNLQEGVNTIDIFALGGYRARMYEFQLTNLPYFEASHIHESSSAWSSNNEYHWHECIYNDGYIFDQEAHMFNVEYMRRDPTCTEQGIKVRCCTVCGYEREIYLSPLGHDWDEGTYLVEPTEETDGIMLYRCTRCSETKQETVKAGHTWGTAVTVEEEGMTKYTKQQCLYDDYERLDIKAIDGTLAEGSAIKENVSGFFKLKSNNNSISYTFNVDRNYFGVIYMKGMIDSYSSTRSRGYYSTSSGINSDTGNFELKVNGDIVDYSHMRGYTYGDLLDGGETNEYYDSGYSPVAECEIGYVALSAGVNTITFTRLNSYNLLISDFVMIVSPTEHVHSLSSYYMADDNTHWRTCNGSNCYYDSNHRFEEEPHMFDDGVVLAEATCNQEGIVEKTCMICGRRVQFTQPATGHYFGEDVIIKEPTCYEEGIGERTCLVCHETVRFTIPCTGHDFISNVTYFNSDGKEVRHIRCSRDETEGYEMNLYDCLDSSGIESSGKIKKGSTLTYKFKVYRTGMIDLYMCAKLNASGDYAFSEGYALRIGEKYGSVDIIGKKLSEFGATSNDPVYFKFGSINIEETDIDENGEVTISIDFSNNQSYRHIYSDTVRIVYTY